MLFLFFCAAAESPVSPLRDPFSCGVGEGVDDCESFERVSLLEIAERVERAIERMLAVSDPRGAEVRPGVLTVVEVEMELVGEPEARPLGRGESALTSPFR